MIMSSINKVCKRPKSLLRGLAGLMLCLFVLVSARAQSDEEYSVRWIGQFPIIFTKYAWGISLEET